MHLKKYKTLLLSFSLIIVSACGSAPKGDYCAIDSEDGLVCRRPDGTIYFLDFKGAQNYFCLSPEYAEKLFQYWSTRCSR